MGRWFWFGFTGLLVAGMLTGGYVMFTPKIGHATPAAIEAVLPASLKVQDAPDPEGQARYARLVEILKGIDKVPLSTRPGPKMGKSTAENEAVLAKIEALLKEGSLRCPERTMHTLFREGPALKDAAKLIALAVKAAQERGDRAACARWAELGLQYSEALRQSGGVAIDELVNIAADAVVVRAIYLAEINGGFDAAGRARMLALLKPSDGSSPAMAAAVRRDFQVFWKPLLLDPDKHAKELAPYEGDEFGPVWEGGGQKGEDESKLAGTFDPVETARLSGKVYDAVIGDLRRPYSEAGRTGEKLVEQAAQDLPNPAFSGPEGMWYRVRMNLGKNTLGRQGISTMSLLYVGQATARNAATRNLVRAVILLRMGQLPALPDPYGKGNLRFNRARQIVWSVGPNGLDDNGLIGKGWENSTGDYGCPYGDRSWAPKEYSGPPGGPPPGMPPLPAR